MPPICRNQGHSHLSLSARLGVNEACAFWADLRATLTKHDLKGILHPKIKILISFTHPQVEFLQLNTKEDILKNDWNFGTIDFHSIFFSYYGSQWCQTTVWFQSFFKISE